MMTRLFRELQQARFSELYLEKCAGRLRLFANVVNAVSAISATGAVVNLLTAANQSNYAWVALTLSSMAAIAAAAAPVLGWDSKAASYEKAAFGYRIVRERIRQLLADMKVSDVTAEQIARDAEIAAFRLAFLAVDTPDNKTMIEECWARTLEEMPSDQAWAIV